MTAPVSQVLSEAADLLEKPGAWTQNAFARDWLGRMTGPLSTKDTAVCWCVMGATCVAGQDADEGQAADDFLRGFLGIPDLASWNDTPGRTQAEVVAKLREAAALAKEQGR
ncbi:hypothetical protein [Sphingomonas sp. Leaf10]|uniref:DUF6197 family protein n=1 Tax=Sphingomonas sp. Leaf10 TaxID=1735676 RepID=UPI0006FB7B89|nr:hypothetical protein [Sphingomonas sp. Leaf10]KQM37975.1 hypothetical protein ASE59_11800 [Sphingomonas sp. Leaf10]